MRLLKRSAKITIHLLVLLVSVSVYAQNDPQFTQYLFNRMYLNPGATGIGGKTEVNAIYRTQWTGYTGTFDQGGGPTTQLLSASIPFSALKGGLGIYASNDQLGGGSMNREITATYSFHKRIGTNLLGVGLSAGMYSRILDGGEFRPREENDPSIPSTRIGQTQPDFGVGIYLYNPTYQLGLSMKHLNQPTYGFSTETAASPLPRTLYLNGSLLIGVTYTLDISPMFVIKSDFKTVAPELGALVTYNSSLWAGLNYRWQDAASFLIGGNFLNNKIRAGYAMDYVVFGTPAKAPTSHEILLTYYLNPPRSGKKSIIRTPRYRY
ncbi:PorP/SprF family type IX secretion system membrane protein [Jiulongibacter sp. NS-SX5]|uniref:PorP/SprF family type IX secretion system membrane protein n=1 Tax=Jiulongibacter sp. NS-SX5 TaxID=3463854 RepID=UPI0040592446